MAAEQLTLDIEEWRAVEGWPYEVSSHGRVRSLTRIKNGRTFSGRILTPFMHKFGYPRVGLFDKPDKGWRQIEVHVLVCHAFHGMKPSPVHQVAHGDGNPKNNHYTNLRWATPLENAADCLLYGGKKGRPVGVKETRPRKPRTKK